MKTVVVTVTCDGCGADIRRGSQPGMPRLALCNDSKDFAGGFATCMGVYPILEHNYYFCGLTCLDHWSDRRKFKDSLRKAWSDKWIDEHSERHGAFRSYPDAPREVREQNERDFTEAALAAFPMGKPTAPTKVGTDPTSETPAAKSP